MGCTATFPTGHFEGNLSQIVNGQFLAIPVGIEITREKKSGAITILDLFQKTVSTLTIERLEKSQLFVKMPMFQADAIRLVREGACYVGRTGYSIDLCFDDKDLVMEVLGTNREPLFRLTGTRFSGEQKFQFEEPRKYQLDEAINIALQKNFNSQIEFEKMIQAKKIAQAAYLSLLPRLNIFTVMANVPFNPAALGFQIGDLAPFLLPTRWFQAKQAGFEAKAEESAYTLMRADLATEVEGLAYAHERDRNVLSYYREILRMLSESRARFLDLQKNRGEQKPTDTIVTQLDLVIKSMTLDLLKVTAVTRSDRYSLSQALGLHHPEGVIDIVLSDEIVNVENVSPMDSQYLAELALRRSFEIQQMEYVIEAARWANREIWFSWMDMMADPRLSISPAMFPLIKISKSRIKDLNLKKEQIQALLVQKAFETVANYNESIESYPLTKELFRRSEEQLSRVVFMSDGGLNVDELEAKANRALVDFVRRETVLASFRISRAAVDRLTLQGSYIQLLKSIFPKPAGTPVPSLL